MQLAELIIGTVLLIFMIIMAIKGRQYDSYVEQLEDSKYPLKPIYCIGYGWSSLKLFALKGRVKSKLIGQAKLLYDPRYAEYYASVVWAQVLSFVNLFLCAGFILAGAFDFTFFALCGVIFAFAMGYYFFTKMKNELETRKSDCTVELPEIVSTMALLINSGMVLREAWKTIAYSKEGTVYTLMQSACIDMQNGVSEIDAIHKFGTLSNSQEISKFTGALIQGLEKGSSELSSFLIRQSSDMWALKKQIMLQKGEAAASKLLLPIALIFVGIMIVVVAGAIGMLI